MTECDPDLSILKTTRMLPNNVSIPTSVIVALFCAVSMVSVR